MIGIIRRISNTKAAHAYGTGDFKRIDFCTQAKARVSRAQHQSNKLVRVRKFASAAACIIEFTVATTNHRLACCESELHRASTVPQAA